MQTTIICCRDSLPSEARDLVVCDRLPPATDDVSTSLGPDGTIWSLRVSKGEWSSASWRRAPKRKLMALTSWKFGALLEKRRGTELGSCDFLWSMYVYVSFPGVYYTYLWHSQFIAGWPCICWSVAKEKKPQSSALLPPFRTGRSHAKCC